MTRCNQCIVDTNVPINANLATQPNSESEVTDECVMACVLEIENITSGKRKLVLDEADEIFSQYQRHLSFSGQPGQGDRFMKWVHDHQYQPRHITRVPITQASDSYEEFPEHAGLAKFDPNDRIFIAVANAHPDKPPILQSTDSKWWGWNKALKEVGITVEFLCPEYIKSKYKEKMGHE